MMDIVTAVIKFLVESQVLQWGLPIICGIVAIALIIDWTMAFDRINLPDYNSIVYPVPQIIIGLGTFGAISMIFTAGVNMFSQYTTIMSVLAAVALVIMLVVMSIVRKLEIIREKRKLKKYSM